jgi:tetratricopeptide (TPR) repeat protein
VAFLAQALALAQRLGRRDLAVDLRIKRGRAFQGAQMWREARSELEAALPELAPEPAEQDAQLRVFLAQICFWMCDTPSTRRYAAEGLALADQAGRDDLAAQATAWLAEASKSDGDHQMALELHMRAMARSPEPCLPALANAPLSLYWLGRNDEAASLARRGIDAARHANDAAATMTVMPHLGMALAALGRYDEAMRVFEEARQFGRTYELRSLLARAIAMSVGLHLDVYDLDGAEALATEARELSRSVAWAPSEVTTGIDLLLSSVRRQEIGRAEQLLDEVVKAAENLKGWHGWKWQLRLANAHTELAMARGEWDAALGWADDTIERSSAVGRVKYQVTGLRARATALAALGHTHAAVAELRRAIALARPAGDPALFVRVAGTLLAIDGDDELAAEAQAAAGRIVAALPEPAMRRLFVSAAPLRLTRP